MESIIKVGRVEATTYQKGVSIDKAVEAFLSECDIRANSKNVYRRGLLYFFRWVESTCRVISELTRADIISFKDSLLATHSNLSVAGYLVALRRFYEWCEINCIPISQRVSSPQSARTHI